MSTFDGFVKVDHFRPKQGRPRPLLYFLSHVHSDHLVGLDSEINVFVYCSPATRKLLLRLEKYSDRMNLAHGVIECSKQTYKRLKERGKDLLRTIPLNTPTDFEVRPNYWIRVTLLDANHCIGAVMFLIQGGSRTILYTGDIRAEPWWVDNLVRNPVMIPFAHGLKKLDMIYLDTTFASRHQVHSKFPTKATGIAELLEKMLQYPSSTKFHLHAWTYGYEDIWIALSNTLSSKIHVDDFKYDLYNSLASEEAKNHPCHDGPIFAGFPLGNGYQKGCLTKAPDVRLHSCEHGTTCPALESHETVFITPIVTRDSEGNDIREVGAGGGGQDLELIPSLEQMGTEDLPVFLPFLANAIPHRSRDKVLKAFSHLMSSNERTASLETFDVDIKGLGINLKGIVRKYIQTRNSTIQDGIDMADREKKVSDAQSHGPGLMSGLPRNLQFPYSRHSSYEELCRLVQALRPYDVYPCTFEVNNWSPEESMRALFGRYCRGNVFSYDEDVQQKQHEEYEASREFLGANLALRRRFEEAVRQRAVQRSGARRKAESDDEVPTSLQGQSSQNLKTAGSPLAIPTKRRRIDSNASTQDFLPGVATQDPPNVSPDTALTNIQVSFSEITMSRHDKQTSLANSRTRKPHKAIDEAPARSALLAGHNQAKDALAQGTQSAPIDISSDDDAFVTPPEQDVDNLLYHHAPVDARIVEGEDEPDTESAEAEAEENDETEARDTQISLSSSYFETQDSGVTALDIEASKLRRKESYKWARDCDGPEEPGLICSNGGHGKEEIEL